MSGIAIIKANKHIEIVRSSVGGLSSMSQRSCDAIFQVLTKHYSRVGVSVVNNLSDLEALVAVRPDVVFLGLKFIPDNQALGLRDANRIWIADYLEQHSIAYTGSPQVALEFELDKSLAKARALACGLETSPFRVFKANQAGEQYEMPLEFPVFIKPTDRGGGLGIDSDSLAHNFEQLNSKIRSISARFGSDSLVEEYLPGREFSVAILKTKYSEEFSVMPVELIAQPDASGACFLGGQVKSSNSEQAIKLTDPIIKTKVCRLAIDVFHALGSRDYGRVDIRLDKSGVPQFIEANLIPSLISGYGSFPKACVLNQDLGYEPMITQIAELALARSFNLIETKTKPAMANLPFMPSTQAAIESPA